jgi:hypothetical protein
MGNQEGSKKKFYKRWWFWAIIVVVLYVIGSSAGNKDGNSQPAAQQPAKQQEAQQAKPVEEAVIKVTASQLYDDYEANEVAADAKYKDKKVEISGTISSIGKDLMDTPYVALVVAPNNPVFSVQCMFDKAEQSKLASLSKDSKIFLSGKVSSKLGNVIVRDCSIVE